MMVQTRRAILLSTAARPRGMRSTRAPNCRCRAICRPRLRKFELTDPGDSCDMENLQDTILCMCPPRQVWHRRDFTKLRANQIEQRCPGCWAPRNGAERRKRTLPNPKIGPHPWFATPRNDGVSSMLSSIYTWNLGSSDLEFFFQIYGRT